MNVFGYTDPIPNSKGEIIFEVVHEGSRVLWATILYYWSINSTLKFHGLPIFGHPLNTAFI